MLLITHSVSPEHWRKELVLMIQQIAVLSFI